MGLVTLGALIRCIRFDSSPLTIGLLHVSYILNDIAGPISMGATSMIAERWFPAGQRGLATAIAAMANYVGNIASFLIGPAMVESGDPVTGMRKYMWLGALVCIANMGAMLCYFPSQPPLPPSRSASHSHGANARTFTLAAFWSALKTIAGCRQFWVLCGAYGLSGGMLSGWSSTLALNLGTVGIDESTAGWIGCSGIIAGSVAGLAVGAYADRFRHHKAILVATNFIAGLGAVWFALLVMGVFPGSMGRSGLAQIFTAVTLTSTLMQSSVPIFFEAAMEATYPLPEGTVLIFLTASA